MATKHTIVNPFSNAAPEQQRPPPASGTTVDDTTRNPPPPTEPSELIKRIRSRERGDR